LFYFSEKGVSDFITFMLYTSKRNWKEKIINLKNTFQKQNFSF